jgi:hypothetical protein
MAAIEIKTDGHVLMVVITGDATAQELIAVIQEYYPKDDVTDVIWDFTCGSWKNISQSGFKDVARAAKEAVASGTRQGSKTAFVGTAGLEYGLHRMYQTIAEVTGVPITYNTFKTMEEAHQWMA